MGEVGDFPNRYAEALRAQALERDLRNRVEEVGIEDESFWDEWLAAEDPCPSRGNAFPHFAPDLERRIRRAVCYHCFRTVFYR
jgi:hypothetical protein